MRKLVSLVEAYDRPLYVVRRVTTAEKAECDICSGQGRVMLRDKVFTCPQCSGNRFRLTTGFCWEVSKCHFYSATISRDGSVRYEVTVETDISPVILRIPEKDLFETMTEAAIEAAIRTKRDNGDASCKEVCSR